MSLRARTAVTLAATALIGGALTVPAAAAPPRAPDRAASAVVQEDCASPYLRDTASYNGYTAGYSWAWNVEVGYGYNGFQYSARVHEIQCLLNNLWGHEAGTEDGLYGENTRAAVREFQQNVGLAVDGIVGPNTWRVLRIGYQK